MKSGFLTIIGPPNAGKSTLLNTLLQTDLSIVSPKPQTTRNRIAGILTDKEKDFQLIIQDTPGLLKKQKSLLDEKLQKAIEESLENSDIILFLLPSEDNLTTYQDFLKAIQNKKILVVINKIDKKDRELTEEEKALGFSYVKISSLKGLNIDVLLSKIKELLTEEILYYPEDILSDRTERFFVKEYIREALLKNLSEEVPHQLFTDVESMEEKNNIIFIQAFIYCSKESHKGIIIGEKGKMIKKIGQEARKKIEQFLGKQVYLELEVKVRKNWQNDEAFLKKLEYY